MIIIIVYYKTILENYDQWVIFQSLDRIYIYDTKAGHFKIIASKE
jgi:hypothetical protein